MDEFGYREVVPDQTLAEKWREFSLSTGGTQSTLQDIKVSERSNGYWYRDGSSWRTRNRFIYWRIDNDVLELTEQSFDANLSGNRVRFRFTDTPVLDGISVHEFYDSVVILIPTVCSVHRLSFPHPDRAERGGNNKVEREEAQDVLPSVFASATSQTLNDPASFCVVTNPNGPPHCAASYLNAGLEEALYLLAYPSGELVLVRQPFAGACRTVELKPHEPTTTMVPRFLSGLAGALRRGGGGGVGVGSDGNAAAGCALCPLGAETYAVALCRDGVLRAWSCSRGGERAGAFDVCAGEAPESLALRAAGDGRGELAVHLGFGCEDGRFEVLRCVGGPTFAERECTLHAPEHDLTDFAIAGRTLWAAWRGSDGDCVVCRACLDDGRWSLASMTDDVVVDVEPGARPDLDPAQAYAEAVFRPGRFSPAVVRKALSIYRRCQQPSVVVVIVTDATADEDLRSETCAAVDAEVRIEAERLEISDEDYVEIATRCWARFYSCCVQYGAAAAKPLGLLPAPPDVGALLLRRASFSLLRPLDDLERDWSSPAGDSLACLLARLDRHLSDDFKSTFDGEMSRSRSPDVIVSEVVMDLMAGACDDNPVLPARFLWSFAQLSSELYPSMQRLLDRLRMDGDGDGDGDGDRDRYEDAFAFASELGASLVAGTVRQQTRVRLAACRALLVLQHVLLERRELDWGTLEAVRSVCMPDTVLFAQAYHATSWLCGEPWRRRCRVPPSFVGVVNGGAYQFEPDRRPIGLLEAFARARSPSMLLSGTTLGQLASALARSLWPVAGEPILAEWLLAAGQTGALQRHARLLQPWCDWNGCSRSFLLAAALLSSGEPRKALALFLTAAKGVFSERFLRERVVRSESEESRLLTDYYLRVVRLFEMHSARDCCVRVATTALAAADPTDPARATLHSVLFVHRMALGRFDEAHASLLANPDPARREDNLRDLVKTLLDGRRFDRLASLPYGDLLPAFSSLVTARARACDDVDNVYYDFLYAFEMRHGNLRLAATAMYEQAYRLGQHQSLRALDKQLDCYSACLNCLRLVPDRWVLRPADSTEEREEFSVPPRAGLSPNENVAKPPPPPPRTLRRLVQPVDLDGILRERLLVAARCRLARFAPDTLANRFDSPVDLAAVLSSLGLYRTALDLCDAFRLPVEPPFETLASACVRLSLREDADAWDWLAENDLADLTTVGAAPSQAAWNLLRHLLEPRSRTTTRHRPPARAVCQRLVALGVAPSALPCWLTAHLRLADPAALLALYAGNGLVVAAATLATDLLRAAGLGHGKERFGIDRPLLPDAPALCLPLTRVETVLTALRDYADRHPPYLPDCRRLEDAFTDYLRTARHVSENKLLPLPLLL